ncbi:PspC domain-containing protein, partial [Microbacterium sp.]|uniref:ATP-binding protein n=1 Tax=Microbacterium sp. TaxID=51671 RepID=UPI0039E3F577
RPVRPSRWPSAAGATARPPLRRPRSCAVAGVSAGVARHLGASETVVRALFVTLALLAGAGVLLYLWLWAFVPWEDGEDSPTRRAPVAWVLIAASAVGFIGILGAWGIDATTVVWVGPRWVSVPVGLAAAVVFTTVTATGAGWWAALIDRRDPARGPRHALVVRLLAVAVMLVAAWVSAQRIDDDGLVVLAVVLIPLGGTACVLVSTPIERYRELSGERIARVREEQRAEMAAHLHDSVLQTLALIQNRAGASSEAARLARAQERELRAWLYDGDAPADSDLPTDLRDYAGGLELDYPVRIDVVSAGSSTERASGEVAAAAREAMLNAARHAGGDISVYIEGTASSVDVFVRDRGPGFDPEAVPADRWGVRESIVGRMRRIGGTATIRPGAGGGTEVHLRLTTAGGRYA